MNRLITFRNNVIVMLLLTSVVFYGQSKSVETFNASEDMTVEVNSAYTNIIFKTWNKNKVEVEAFIDDESLTEAEKQEYFEAWKFNVLGNSKKVMITSNAQENFSNDNYTYDFDDININLDFLGPLLESIEVPDMSNMTGIIMESVGNIDFDYEAFQENEEEYLDKFEKEMEQNFGPEFEEKMEAWGEKLGENMEKWGEEFGKQFEERYGDDLERQVNGKEKGSKAKTKNKNKNKSKNTKVKKTIIIKMPKNTKTEINVRHGELKMADAYNLKATLNYSPFTANNIDGGLTLINAAYAPVVITNWNQGSINVNYVEDCQINNVESINLQAISSNVLIGNIDKSAIISGSIGDLKINEISSSFNNIDIVLETTDATIKLPNTAFSFYYNGKKTKLDIPIPTNLQLTKTVNGNRIIQKGFHISKSQDKFISINSSYSNVVIQ